MHFRSAYCTRFIPYTYMLSSMHVHATLIFREAFALYVSSYILCISRELSEPIVRRRKSSSRSSRVRECAKADANSRDFGKRHEGRDAFAARAAKLNTNIAHRLRARRTSVCLFIVNSTKGERELPILWTVFA